MKQRRLMKMIGMCVLLHILISPDARPALGTAVLSAIAQDVVLHSFQVPNPDTDII